MQCALYDECNTIAVRGTDPLGEFEEDSICVYHRLSRRRRKRVEEAARSPEAVNARTTYVKEEELQDAILSLERCTDFLRGVTLSLRGIFSAEMMAVPEYDELKGHLVQDATRFKEVLLPLIVACLVSLGKFFDSYLEEGLHFWSKSLGDWAAIAMEQENICFYLAEFMRRWGESISRWPELAQKVLDAYLIDGRKIRKEIDVLRLQSKVAEPLFVPLLFLPVGGEYAVPLVRARADFGTFAKPFPADTQFELAIVCARVAAETVGPAVAAMDARLMELGSFFQDLASEMNELNDLTPLCEEEVEQRLSGHYEVVHRWACQFQRRCMEVQSLASLLEADVEPVPFNKEFYDESFEWLLKIVSYDNETPVCDCFYDSTSNVNILLMLQA